MLDRRRVLLGLATAGTAVAANVPAFAQKFRHAAIVYMEGVASDLFKAQNAGTVTAFNHVIAKHADVQSIGLYALGQYRSDLAKADHTRYYRGVALFMARYFADQTRLYRVAKAEFDSEPSEDEGDQLVRAKITLMSGTAYNVVFRLSPHGSRYKVSDVKVLGFSLSYLQRSIFVSFLNKQGGSVQALLAALAR